MSTTGSGGDARPHDVTVLLALGADHDQVPAIEVARQLGHHVVAVDPDPEAPGMALADVTVTAELTDAGTVVAVAAEHHVGAVIPAPAERWLTTVGRVNDALGLRGVSHASALACVDARRFHRRCRRAGVRRPEQLVAGDAAELATAIGQVGRPCLLRPATGTEGEAVVVIGPDDDVDALIAWHLADRPAGDESVVEPVLAGQQLGVDAAVVRGAIELVLLRTRELTPPPFRVPVADLAPAPADEARTLAVRRELQRVVQALALTDCLLRATVNVADDELVTVLGASACPAGDHVADTVVPTVTGVPYLENGVRLVLGEEVLFAPARRAGAVRRRLWAPPGRVVRVGPPPKSAADPDVLVFSSPLAADQLLEPVATAADAAARGTVVTRGVDAEAAARLADRVVGELDVEVEPAPSPGLELSGTAAR
jgi:hypothetical protein